jgi:superfamily II DNA or RNA helicase
MIAEIIDNQFVYLSHITIPEEEAVWKDFSISKPNRYVDPSQLGNWDGVFRFYNRAKKRFALPLLARLIALCEREGLPLTVEDKRESWKYTPVAVDQINEDFLPGIVLADYQLEAIRQVCLHENGVFDVPTGGGKGELIAGICKAIPCPTVILADQTIVVDQLKSRLELRDIANDIGVFYAGKRPNGQMILVGSIQSLTAITKTPIPPDRRPDESDASFKKRLEKWSVTVKGLKTRRENTKKLLEVIKKTEMVLVDECDKATSDPFKNLFRFHFKGRRRYGFSGTPVDPSKPVEALVMENHLGPIIFKESRKRLTELGRIIPCTYHMMAFGLEGSIKDSSAFDIATNDWLINNPKMHRLIADLCKKLKKGDDGTLVLVDREELGLHLLQSIESAGLRVRFIYGKTPKQARNDALRSFERREIDVLIGGKIINRGLDLNGGCENLIIATGGKLASDFIQKVGRALRHNKKGKSQVYDFFFRCNRYLYNHSKARLAVMLEAGYDTWIHFPYGRVDGQELVNSRYRVDKRLYTSGH